MKCGCTGARWVTHFYCFFSFDFYCMREETELKACVSEVLDDVGSSAQVAWMGNVLQTGEGAPSDFLWSTFISAACIPHRHAVCYQPLICCPVEGHHQHPVCVLSPVLTFYGPQIWRPPETWMFVPFPHEERGQCLISSWSTVRIPLSLCCSVSGCSLRITLTVFLSCSCMLS